MAQAMLDRNIQSREIKEGMRLWPAERELERPTMAARLGLKPKNGNPFLINTFNAGKTDLPFEEAMPASRRLGEEIFQPENAVLYGHLKNTANTSDPFNFNLSTLGTPSLGLQLYGQWPAHGGLGLPAKQNPWGGLSSEFGPQAPNRWYVQNVIMPERRRGGRGRRPDIAPIPGFRRPALGAPKPPPAGPPGVKVEPKPRPGLGQVPPKGHRPRSLSVGDILSQPPPPGPIVGRGQAAVGIDRLAFGGGRGEEYLHRLAFGLDQGTAAQRRIDAEIEQEAAEEREGIEAQQAALGGSRPAERVLIAPEADLVVHELEELQREQQQRYLQGEERALDLSGIVPEAADYQDRNEALDILDRLEAARAKPPPHVPKKKKGAAFRVEKKDTSGTAISPPTTPTVPKPKPETVKPKPIDFAGTTPKKKKSPFHHITSKGPKPPTPLQRSKLPPATKTFAFKEPPPGPISLPPVPIPPPTPPAKPISFPNPSRRPVSIENLKAEVKLVHELANQTEYISPLAEGTLDHLVKRLDKIADIQQRYGLEVLKTPTPRIKRMIESAQRLAQSFTTRVDIDKAAGYRDEKSPEGASPGGSPGAGVSALPSQEVKQLRVKSPTEAKPIRLGQKRKASGPESKKLKAERRVEVLERRLAVLPPSKRQAVLSERADIELALKNYRSNKQIRFRKLFKEWKKTWRAQPSGVTVPPARKRVRKVRSYPSAYGRGLQEH